jgi:F-type H+-transporting ATPase subunit gamma
LRPFAKRLNELTNNVLSHNVIDSPFVRQSNSNKILLVVIASNSGLCGVFNNVIIKETLARINFFKKENENCEISLYCIGKKTVEFFSKHSNINIFKKNTSVFENISYQKTAELSSEIMKAFENGTFDKVEIISNVFLNAATYKTEVYQFLPFENKVENLSEGDKDEYIYLPEKQLIVDYLLNICLKQSFYSKLIDSFTAEHGARMTSMHKATDNANEMLKSLKLSFNKARQTAITNEIIEITNGANALNG